MPIVILGTSHIAQQSVRQIESEIAQRKPKVVAVELDAQRAISLFQKQRGGLPLGLIAKIGVRGYLFALLGRLAQQQLGKKVGTMPGADMKAAILAAKKEEAVIALIDRSITTTLARLSKAITWKEKARFIADIFKGFFTPKKQAKLLGLEQLDLTKVPQEAIIEKMMDYLKKRYPSIYKVLLTERNKYMVKKLKALEKNHPNELILAVVGAAHKKGMLELLKN